MDVSEYEQLRRKSDVVTLRSALESSVTRFGKNLKMSLAIFWKIIQYLAKFCTYIGKK